VKEKSGFERWAVVVEAGLDQPDHKSAVLGILDRVLAAT
jgi:hypothetical protein